MKQEHVSKGILSGIRVIELTEALAGPYCAMYLGDLGADVIKIERVGVGDASRRWAPPYVGDQSAYFLSTNRNKRSLTLNINSEEGLAILHKLLDTADVFITNQPRMSSLKKRGLDPESCLARNPRLIHVSITGFGHTGPRAGSPGYDIVAQAMSGSMSLTGPAESDEPYRFPSPLADMSAGMYAFASTLAALFHRERTGEGQAIDVSLLESQLSWMTNLAGAYFATGEPPKRRGNDHPTITPYRPFRAGDGRYFILAVGSEPIWQRFCKAVGLEHLVDDPRFATNPDRLQHRQELYDVLEPHFLQKSAEEWLTLLKEANVPSAPIYRLDEALNDPHVLARGMVVSQQHPSAGTIRNLAFPGHFSATPARFDGPPPRLGEHTDEILQELGYDVKAIQELRGKGVV